MSFVAIPLQADANQTFDTTLDGASATFTLKTTDYGLFVDVVYNGVQVIAGALARDRIDMNRAKWLGLAQPLWFADLKGTTDPVYSGFGSRYLLLYGTSGNEQQTVA